MPISETARRNHEELFPNHESTLKITDPEFIEIFDNFAFDEVVAYGGFDPRKRLMIILASSIACQSLNEYRVMLGAALRVGVTPVEAREILYHAVPYVGYPRALNAIRILNETAQAKREEKTRSAATS